MKLITANKLNRFWKKGVKPIMDSMALKFESTKIVRDMDTINALTQEGYVPDALIIKQLNGNLRGLELITDDTGRITGYKTLVGGADTVFPFTGDSVYLGTSSPVDVSGIYPGYHNLTASDFIIGATSSIASLQANSPAAGNYYKTLNFGVSHSYDPDTGILTFSGKSAGEYVDTAKRLHVSGGIQNVFAVLIIPK